MSIIIVNVPLGREEKFWPVKGDKSVLIHIYEKWKWKDERWVKSISNFCRLRIQRQCERALRLHIM